MLLLYDYVWGLDEALKYKEKAHSFKSLYSVLFEEEGGLTTNGYVEPPFI